MFFIPVFITYFLIKNHKDLPIPSLKNRIGMLYGNLEMDKVIKVMYYPFFLARRFLITLVIVFMSDYPFAQVQILLLSSSLLLIYYGLYEPQVDLFMDRIDIFNELSTLAMAYFVVLFSTFV